jgi:hypothetical protein
MPFLLERIPFALPNKFENYAVAFERRSLEYYLLENDLISNKTKKLDFQNKQIPLTYELFKNDALILNQYNLNR